MGRAKKLTNAIAQLWGSHSGLRTRSRCATTILLAIPVCASFAVLALKEAHAQADSVIEERVYLRTKIQGRTVRLETYIVKRADARGRLPIAFFNHGRPGAHYNALDQAIDTGSRNFARDLARRGWLAVGVNRRGFGQSDGAIQADNHSLQANNPLSCKNQNHKRVLSDDADDIQAVIEVIAQRPDADPTRIITLGVSAGGGASIELGARNLPGLLAAINLGGGFAKGNDRLGKAICDVDEHIRRDFREFGTRSKVENLWMFANNDSRHPPAEIELMRSSFVAGGANLRVIDLGKLGEEGHRGLGTFSGRAKWLAELDNWFRAKGLPTWPRGNVDLLMQRLRFSEKNRQFVENYLGSAGEVALAKSTRSGYVIYYNALTVEEARTGALQDCQAKAPPCVIVMENDRWLGGR